MAQARGWLKWLKCVEREGIRQLSGSSHSRGGLSLLKLLKLYSGGLRLSGWLKWLKMVQGGSDLNTLIPFAIVTNFLFGDAIDIVGSLCQLMRIHELVTLDQRKESSGGGAAPRATSGGGACAAPRATRTGRAPIMGAAVDEGPALDEALVGAVAPALDTHHDEDAAAADEDLTATDEDQILDPAGS